MPEVEKLNVKIEADASSLKKETNESIEALERLQAKYNEISASLSNAFAKNGKADLIASLSEQRNEIMRLINDLKAGVISPNDNAIAKALGDIDTKPIENAQEEVKQLNRDLQEVKGTQKEINVGWDTSGIKNLGKQVKKALGAIVGATTVFSLIRKSMNTYLAQNDALREKLQGIYYALGSMFAPILEWLINLFAKLVLYVNAFLKGLGLGGIQFKNISNSAKKTEKTMRTLISGFDELNTIQKQSQDNSEGGIADPFANVKVNQEWIDKLTKLGEKLRPVFEWLRDTLKTIFDWVLDHIELVIAGLLAIKAIKFLVNVVEAIGGLKALWDVIKTIGSAIVSFITSPLGGAILMFAGWSTAAIAFFEMWKNGWSLLGEIIKDVGIALAAIGAVILGAPATVAAVVAGIVAVLSTLVIVVHEHWDEIVEWTKGLWENLKTVWQNIKNTAVSIWNSLCDEVVDIVNDFIVIMKACLEVLKERCREAWESTKELGKTIWNQLKTDMTQIATATKNQLTTIWNNTKDALSNVWSNTKNIAINAWTSIKNGVISLNQTIGNTVTSIWNGIKNTIKSVVNGIIGFINGMIRGIVNGINAVVNLLNKFSVDIPDWVPGFGGRHFGFNLRTVSAPQIPSLARGGIIKEPTLAMLGEYSNAGSNPEIAVPQNVLQDMLIQNNTELVSSFAQMTSQIISAINGVDMEVTIGDETIARSAARGNNNYKSMTGKSLITV